MFNKKPIISRISLMLVFLLFLVHCKASAQNNENLNALAKKYLSREQVEKLTPLEIKGLNFLFESSYIVDTTTTIYKKWVIDNGPLDIVLLNKHRKYSERVFYKNEKYPGLIIELFSRKEIDDALKTILK